MHHYCRECLQSRYGGTRERDFYWMDTMRLLVIGRGKGGFIAALHVCTASSQRLSLKERG